MKISTVVFLIFIICSFLFAKDYEKDIIKTEKGDLEITFLGHGTLMFHFAEKVIHLDPFGGAADYSDLPKADLILLTHQHGDHLDIDAVEKIRTTNTKVFLTSKCFEKTNFGTILKNGDTDEWNGIKVEAVPAYNLLHKRDDGLAFHPKGEGNGYVLTIAGQRIYIAGDTENTSEMKALKNIDVAFLPMNLPYTMTPEMVADAVKAFRPKVLYPYHYGTTDPDNLLVLLRDIPDLEVRIRQMQ